MQRLLVANRGEIALRIIRTAAEIGLETVGVYSPEDESLAQGYGADQLLPLPARGASAYLDIETLIQIAQDAHCDALHPGYGFLSERADFAEACRASGILFVGPRTETLALFGDKARARELATQVGVPVLPGTSAPATLAELKAFADAQPTDTSILLKAVSGGGGRGMRKVGPDDDLEAAFNRCASEAQRSFGNDALFAERTLEKAKHIEIQILADDTGATSHLWERDCTLQRRHQKLIEIAPSPSLDPALRNRLIDAALSLAKAAHYSSLGTFEFLLDSEGGFYFIEANPRLQVEHTVTEEMTGLDLVEIQLRLAMGERLVDLGLDEVPEPKGFAIQLRVLAEELDATGNPQPSHTVASKFAVPTGPGLRIDTAFRAGLAPHPAFDSLIAKLIVSNPNRDFTRTLHRAQHALKHFKIEGPKTNLGLLAALLHRPELETNRVTTTFVAEHAEALSAEAQRRFAETTPLIRSAPSESARGADVRAATEQGLPENALAIRSPLIGTLIEISVQSDEDVVAGQPLFVLESMKMEHVVVSPASGQIIALAATLGDVLGEDALLAGVLPSNVQSEETREIELRDLDEIRPDLRAVLERDALLTDEARPDAVDRRRHRGQRTARENLSDLVDAGSFSEYGALAIAAMRKVRPVEELQRQTPGDAIITGTATINAAQFGSEGARCAVLLVDATVLAGTQGFYHHQKIDRILEVAEQAGSPVIFFPEGGGGRPNDTDTSDLFVAGLNITSFHTFAKLSGKVPRISVVSGFCFAGSAAFAGCADLIIATRKSHLGMGGPAMIEGGGLGVFDKEEVGPMSVQEPNGVVDLVVEDEQEAILYAQKAVAYFQGSLSEWTAPDPRVLRQIIPENRRRIYDVRRVIDGLFDLESVLELRRAFGVGMITCFARMEGRPVGVLANDPNHLGGAIDEVGAEKAARFLQLCDAFGIPIVSLCDTPGFMVGPEIESRAQVRKVSRLFVVGASLQVPVFCVILRKAYGLGAQAMAGGSFRAPFDIFAWPTGEIGGMGLEGAVRLGFKKQLEALEEESEKTALFDKLVGLMYEKGKALHAASQLEFDAVIDPAETRDRILRGLKQAGHSERSARSFVDTW